MKLESITVYVLRGLETRKRYVGITKDLERRLAEHRQASSKGGQMLGAFELVLTEDDYPSYQAARTREKFLKSGQGRQWLDGQLGR